MNNPKLVQAVLRVLFLLTLSRSVRLILRALPQLQECGKPREVGDPLHDPRLLRALRAHPAAETGGQGEIQH